MDKKTTLVVAVVAVAIVSGLLIFSKPQAPTNTQSTPDKSAVTQPTAKLPDTVPGVMPGSVMGKIQKIVGQQVFYVSLAKELSVTVGADTQIVKQVNNNGVFKDVVIKLSDLKAGQIIEISFGASQDTAKLIRVLQ